MNQNDTNQQQKKRGIPLEDVLVPVVFIVGIAGSIFLLRRFTSLPSWAAISLGIVGFPVLLFGALRLTDRKH